MIDLSKLELRESERKRLVEMAKMVSEGECDQSDAGAAAPGTAHHMSHIASHAPVFSTFCCAVLCCKCVQCKCNPHRKKHALALCATGGFASICARVLWPGVPWETLYTLANGWIDVNMLHTLFNEANTDTAVSGRYIPTHRYREESCKSRSQLATHAPTAVLAPCTLADASVRLPARL